MPTILTNLLTRGEEAGWRPGGDNSVYTIAEVFGTIFNKRKERDVELRSKNMYAKLIKANKS